MHECVAQVGRSRQRGNLHPGHRPYGFIGRWQKSYATPKDPPETLRPPAAPPLRPRGSFPSIPLVYARMLGDRIGDLI